MPDVVSYIDELIEVLNTQLATYNNDIKELQTTIGTLKMDVAKHESTLHRLVDAVKTCEEKMDLLVDGQDEIHKMISAITSQTNSISMRLQEKVYLIPGATDTVSAENLIETVATMRKDITSIDERLTHLIEAIREDLQVATRLGKLEESIDSLHQTMTTWRGSTDMRIQRLEIKNATYTSDGKMPLKKSTSFRLKDQASASDSSKGD